MPRWAQVIGEWLPLTHYMRIVRAIMLKGASCRNCNTTRWRWRDDGIRHDRRGDALPGARSTDTAGPASITRAESRAAYRGPRGRRIRPPSRPAADHSMPLMRKPVTCAPIAAADNRRTRLPVLRACKERLGAAPPERRAQCFRWADRKHRAVDGHHHVGTGSYRYRPRPARRHKVRAGCWRDRTASAGSSESQDRQKPRE